MKKLIIMAVLALGVFTWHDAAAQKVIKDANGDFYIDVQDMPTSSFSTATVNTINKETNTTTNKLYKRFQIASKDMAKMNWIVAAGIDSRYLTTSAVGQKQGTVNTGCSTYAEDGNLGDWRLPTQRELLLIYAMKPILIDMGLTPFLDANYWTSTEYDATLSWIVVMNTGVNNRYGGGKGLTSNNTRCIREVK